MSVVSTEIESSVKVRNDVTSTVGDDEKVLIRESPKLSVHEASQVVVTEVTVAADPML